MPHTFQIYTTNYQIGEIVLLVSFLGTGGFFPPTKHFAETLNLVNFVMSSFRFPRSLPNAQRSLFPSMYFMYGQPDQKMAT